MMQPTPAGFRGEQPGVDIGFCWIFKDTAPLEGLQRLKAFGFEGIELWPDALKQYGVEAWKKALAATGMRCLQLCPYFNFMGGETTMTASRKMFEEYMAYAAALDCYRLRVFTGPPWGEGVVGGSEATPQQWLDAITGLREFCDGALSSGVELCLECHEGSLMENGPLALRLIHAVDRPNLTVNLQLPLLNEDWKQSLDLLAHRTTHIHIHNWTESLGRGDLVYLEEGKFDWLPVVDRLVTEYGRRVCLSVEHGDHYGRHDAWETARRDGPYLQSLKRVVQG
jgi:sugar phosphate isomerase/epimerase